MNLEEYRGIFVISTLTLILIANIPLISLILPSITSREIEPFSELWVLGPGHLIYAYPFNVEINKEEIFFVGVSNHLDSLAYYKVHLKLCNSTQLLPEKTKPSSLPPLREFRFFLDNGEEWETKIDFTVLNVSLTKNSSIIKQISINGEALQVNYSTNWDFKTNGFYYHILFELWLYNNTLKRFEYHERFVSVRLNMTGS